MTFLGVCVVGPEAEALLLRSLWFASSDRSLLRDLFGRVCLSRKVVFCQRPQGRDGEVNQSEVCNPVKSPGHAWSDTQQMMRLPAEGSKHQLELKTKENPTKSMQNQRLSG